MIDNNKIKVAVNEWIKSTDCFLVDIKSGTSKLAVYIDKPTGVSLDECISLNKYLSAAFDNDGIWETYELEVSSPGMDQPLKVPQQYLRRLGQEILVTISNGVQHKGKLISANETGFKLQEITSRKENKKKVVTETTHEFKYDQIKETKLIISFKN